MARGHNPIGMACGVLPEFEPEVIAASAAAGGFDATGLQVRVDRWTPATTRAVKQALGGFPVLDIEALGIPAGPLPDAAFRMLDIGAELGTANMLVVAQDPDHAAIAEKLAALANYAEGSNMRIALEFGLWNAVHGYKEADAIVVQAAHPSLAVLPDSLHLHRAGLDMAGLADVPADRLSYAQFCDAPADIPDGLGQASLLHDALDRRCLPGEGAVDLRGFIAALPPNLPLGVELRSRALREREADPVARARIVADATRDWLRRTFPD